MQTVSLSGSSRENVGKKDATLLRREGKVPSVLYGGKEQVHFHVSENDVKKIMRKNLREGSYKSWRKRVREFSDRRETYKKKDFGVPNN